jgi:hypothetical protein
MGPLLCSLVKLPELGFSGRTRNDVFKVDRRNNGRIGATRDEIHRVLNIENERTARALVAENVSGWDGPIKDVVTYVLSQSFDGDTSIDLRLTQPTVIVTLGLAKHGFTTVPVSRGAGGRSRDR